MPDSERTSGIDHVLRRQDVRRDALDRVCLDQGQLLVRSGVEHHVRPIPRHHVRRATGAPNIGEDRHGVREAVVVTQGSRKFDERYLRLVDKDELANPQLRQPRSKFGPE